MSNQQLEILEAVQVSPGITLSDLQYWLNRPVRNDLSDLIRQSYVYQDPKSGFHLSPGGKQLISSRAA